MKGEITLRTRTIFLFSLPLILLLLTYVKDVQGEGHEDETLSLSLGDGVELELVRIPAGEFTMGEADYSRALIGLFAPHDLRSRQVNITRSFYIGKFEVTVDQFRRFTEASGYRTDAERGKRPWKELKTGCYTLVKGEWMPAAKGSWKDPGFKQDPNHPVTCISWHDANEFCRWLGSQTRHAVRLPTEAELEYAQRAKTPTRYYWGKKPADYVRDPRLPIGYWANVADSEMAATSDADLFLTGTEMRSLIPDPRDDGYTYTAPVGEFYPNPFGLYDTIGNVWEYTLDWAGEDPARVDPRGADSSEIKGMRGGSWVSTPDAYRPSYRAEIEPEGRTSTRGMRVLVEE